MALIDTQPLRHRQRDLWPAPCVSLILSVHPLTDRYKQYAAIQSDANFQSRRRAFIRKANELDMKDTWTFEWWARANYNPPEIGGKHTQPAHPQKTATC
jgi:hypothetical protein